MDTFCVDIKISIHTLSVSLVNHISQWSCKSTFEIGSTGYKKFIQLEKWSCATSVYIQTRSWHT